MNEELQREVRDAGAARRRARGGNRTWRAARGLRAHVSDRDEGAAARHDVACRSWPRTDGTLWCMRWPERRPVSKTVPLADEHRPLLTEPWDFFLFDDLLQDAVEKDQPPARAGFRSLLRIAIRVQGQVVGSLAFASRETGFYKRSDVLVGRRIADHVALALSHARLAEAAQRAAEARERRDEARASREGPDVGSRVASAVSVRCSAILHRGRPC